MKTKILAAAICCMSIACHAAELSQLAIYSRADGDEPHIAFAMDRSAVWLGHIAVDTTPCAIGDGASCIRFDGHVFTVIDRDVSTPEIHVTKEQEDFVDAAGTKTAAVKISVRAGDFHDTYWYSPSRGLLAINLALARDGAGTGPTFVLMGNCGYGASRDCEAE